MDKLEQLKEAYENVKNEPVYAVRYESTGKITGYEPAPELLIGRVPVYEKQYLVKELNLRKKEDLFSALVGTYGERIFSSKEEAEEKATWLNEHDKELDIDDLLM